MSIEDSNDLESAFIMYNNQLTLQGYGSVSPEVKVSPKLLQVNTANPNQPN
jgi:hypothetical protein